MRLQSGQITLPCLDGLALVEMQLNFSNTRALKLDLHTVYPLFFFFFPLWGWVFTCRGTINSPFAFHTPNKHGF